ncbi:hypothetical protein Tco_0830993, partial [Tanacetum coccineum]
MAAESVTCPAKILPNVFGEHFYTWNNLIYLSGNDRIRYKVEIERTNEGWMLHDDDWVAFVKSHVPTTATTIHFIKQAIDDYMLPFTTMMGRSALDNPEGAGIAALPGTAGTTGISCTYQWSKKDNVLPRALAWSNVAKFGKNDYNGLLGPSSRPWFKASIKYINGLVDLDMNVSEDDIGGDVSNNYFYLNDNVVSGNGNNDDQQDKQPSLADVLDELRALRKEFALLKVDDTRIAKLERILNDNFIPCNDRSKGNHNAVNPGLTTSANHPLSTCSRHVVDNPEVACAGTGIHNPARNNDSRNSNHNAVNTGLSCSANDHMSSCFSPEMPNDEVVVAGTAIHNADNDVNERIGVSSNYSMMHNAEVLAAGMGIDKADENIYKQTPMIMMSTKELTPWFSTCSGPDMHLAEVAIAGMEIDKGDRHIDIPTASDNDVNLAKSVSVNDPMPISVSPDMLNAEVAICSMGFQNEVAPNAVYEGNVVSAKEVGLDVLIQVACDGMGINKADGYSQCEPFTLNALIEGFDSQNNNPGIDFLQHDDHVDCSVAKPNDHPTVDIGVKPVH